MQLSSRFRFLKPRVPRHGTVIAYVALALATAVPASAALQIRSADIVNGQVKRVDLGDNAVIGSKVANDSLSGADIDEASLLVTRMSNHIKGGLTVSAPQSPASNPYPLSNAGYNQPAETSELYFGTFKVTFPSTCDPSSGGGSRSASVEIFVNGKSVGSGYISDQGTDSVTKSGPLLTVGGGFVTAKPAHRTVTAQVQSSCDQSTSSGTPNVVSVKVDVARFR